jgi:hypothetical protein
VTSFKVNDLFRPGPNGDLNACVGENGGPYDFFDYALGYFKGAMAIARAAERRELPVDIAVYPMVYSYGSVSPEQRRHRPTVSIK